MLIVVAYICSKPMILHIQTNIYLFIYACRTSCRSDRQNSLHDVLKVQISSGFIFFFPLSLGRAFRITYWEHKYVKYAVNILKFQYFNSMRSQSTWTHYFIRNRNHIL
ncbi:unnamed protein product [Rotaria socialis]